MNTGGDAAEQIVRMSLQGFEVAAKISGAGAKNIAILLYSILKEERKTKGKARLTSMLRSGKELKVFTVKRDDLQKFTQEAKKYGVLYCVLTDRKNKDPNAEVDVIARAEDASKISRIVERFHVASVDTASIVTTAEKSKEGKEGQPEPEITKTDPEQKDQLLDALMGKPTQKDQISLNPLPAKTEKSPLSAPTLEKQSDIAEGIIKPEGKASVRKELERIKKQRAVAETDVTPIQEKEKGKKKPVSQTRHQQPPRKRKTKKAKGVR